MEAEEPKHWTRYALKSLALLLLSISPLGAPLVGYVLIGTCDIPWEGQVQCVVPAALLHYFLAFTILPVAWVGPFLAILWLMLSVAVALACLFHAGRAIWQAVMERS